MLTAGTLIDGRYEIVGSLGSGGMGQVYRARRVRLGDEVAIKVMHAPPDADSELGERFIRESRACARLRHPGIVGILDFSVDAESRPYLVMELLSGPSLRDELELGPLQPAAALAVLEEVGAALELAHEQGIVHRDLKPANIVAHRYESGERVYKVIDFGLASLIESDETRLTTPFAFLGTLSYAAPEQLRGEPVDRRTDLYSLAVIAYEMLTGKRPFTASDNLTLMNHVLTSTPTRPGENRPGLSADLDVVLLRALAKQPADRFTTVEEFVRAFRAALVPADPGPPQRQTAQDEGLLARYELGPLIARGRLKSLIYKGTHRAMGLPVAIRILKRTDQPSWEAVRARFLVEARTLQVAHPSLLQVRDYGEDERGVFLVTDFIEGPSLRGELSKGALPWPRVSRLIQQILQAASALNRRGGLIAGVNPDMIRLTMEGGVERLMLSTAGIRSVQDVLATMSEQELRGAEACEQELPYVAPEVLMGRAPDPRADVFTVGVLAYQMATGQLPFRANSLPELMGQMLQTLPPAPHFLQPEVPEPASSTILKCLAPNIGDRFQSADDVLAVVEQA
jgi:serine/threonine protein kinase